MGVKIPKTDEGSLNMTPMIDIVFQLILFFLFSLKFKSLAYRIESSLPKDRGLQATPEMKTDIPAIKVLLFRVNEDDKANAYTKVKIAGQEFKLKPDQWVAGNMSANMAMEDERDKRFISVQARIAELYKQNAEFKGEIETPLPSGAAVPHADVVRVLDCFLGVGIKEVNFVGTPQPVPSSKKRASSP